MSDAIKALKARKRTLESLVAGAQFIAGSKGIPSRHQWAGVSGDALTELLQLTGVRVTVSLPDLNSVNAAKQQVEDDLREYEKAAAEEAQTKMIEMLRAQFAAQIQPPPPPPPPPPPTAPAPDLRSITDLIEKAVAAALASQAPNSNT